MSLPALVFNWKILNYSMCHLKKGEYLESPVITTENFKDTNKWYLTLYPLGVNNNKGCISCFLYRYEECLKKENAFSISSTLEIVDPDGKVLASMEKKTVGERGTGLYEFLKIEKLKQVMENWGNDILEIRCNLFDSNYDGQPIMCEAQTEIQLKKYLFDWKILIPELQDWSKTIECPIEDDTQLSITLTAHDDKIYVKVKKSGKPLPSELLKLEISSLNNKGIDIRFQTSTRAFESSEFKTSFEKNLLKDKNSFTLSHSFNLICAIFISNGTLTSTSMSYRNLPSDELMQLAIPHPPLSLQHDLKDLFLNRKHSDVKLRAETGTIPAHKCLLSARSPVFAAMFDGDMMENQTGIVNIPDVDSEVLQSFVEFLYTNAVTNTDYDHLLKLMLVADKYQVIILKEVCSQILMTNLSLENVCEVISVADMVNQLNLKQVALNYIKMNRMKILVSRDWAELVKQNMTLANEILTKLLID